jgi:phospholipase C
MEKPLTDAIEHVVVLMLENRSFDNVLGGLYPERTKKGLYRGLLGNETNPLDPANPRAGSVTVFQGPATSSIWIMPYPDPGERYSDMVRQIFGSNSSVLPSGVLPPMSGFAWNYTQQPPAPSGAGWPVTWPVAGNIMQYYSGAAMPVSSCLAKGYAVCDHWFAAAPVQTLANRVFTHCGTPSRQAAPHSNLSRVNNPDYTKGLSVPFHPPIHDTTIFELFDDTYRHQAGPSCLDPLTYRLNWKIYYHDVPLSALCRHVYQNWCWRSFVGGNVFRFQEHIGRETNFEFDIRNDLLPKYSFIEPRYANLLGGTVNSNHPGGAGLDCWDFNGVSLPPPINLMDGERLLWQIYSILLKYPETFDKTLLIVTYDEHGGLFDHVPPRPAVSPFSPPVDNFDYDRYGVRVPAILINPHIPPGTVYPPRQPFAPLPYPPFDHTSILSTLMAQFDLQGSLSPRVSSAPHLAGLITKDTYPPPACVAPEPEVPETIDEAPSLRPRVTSAPDAATNLSTLICLLLELIQSPRPRP